MPFNANIAAVFNYSLGRHASLYRSYAAGVAGRAAASRRFRTQSSRGNSRSIVVLRGNGKYGEFEGEDAGSPIDARVAYLTAPLDGFFSAGSVRRDMIIPKRHSSSRYLAKIRPSI